MTVAFKASDIVVDRAEGKREIPAPETLGFGRVFSDHMLTVEWNKETGWAKPHIKPYGPIPMDPAASVLHYGMSCFEGMKAYYGSTDGKGRLFRPLRNMARLKSSMDRLGFPTDWSETEFLECIRELLRVDRRWLPPREGFSIYLRPFAYASGAALGLKAPTSVTLAVLLSPSGPYYAQGLKPLDLFVDEEHVRAWPGGSGDRKVANNYAPTVRPTMDAERDHGCPQVLYLLPDGSGDTERAAVSEAGTMNMFFVFNKGDAGLELCTPPLNGTILPGVTRDSLLQLARGFGGIAVNERDVTIGELSGASKAGALLECFGSGTAAVVSPVQRLKRASGEVIECKSDMESKDTLCWRLYETLTGIQTGRISHEWSECFE